jgi:copper chaperone
MEKLLFKTNLKCNGCVNAITPGLNAIPEIKQWKVDLESSDRVLEVQSTEDVSDQVIEKIIKAGYAISRL